MEWSPHGPFDIGCHVCKQAFFCSDRCKTLAFSESHGCHQSICAHLKRLGSLKEDRHCKSVIGLMLDIEVRHHAGVIKRQVEELCRDIVNEAISAVFDSDHDEESLNRLLKKVSADDVSISDKIMTLQSHADSWDDRLKGDWKKCRYFISSCNLNTSIDFNHFASAVESNGFGLFNLKDEMVGRALYTDASFFNHSCESNCTTSRSGSTLYIVANTDIIAGEEMTISYIDTNRPVSARQEQLQSDYQFTCLCCRCLRETNAKHNSKLTYTKSIRTVRSRNQSKMV